MCNSAIPYSTMPSLSSNLHRLLDTAVVFGASQQVTHALDLQDRGNMADAMVELHAINDADPNSFIELLEAESLIAMAQHPEAAIVHEHAADLIPGDKEVAAWTDVASRPNPLPLAAKNVAPTPAAIT
jgi:hypothetical protein